MNKKTTNQDYGGWFNPSKQPSQTNQNYPSNSYNYNKINQNDLYGKDYYSRNQAGVSYNPSSHLSDSGAYPRFNVNVVKSKDSIHSEPFPFPACKSMSSGLPNLGNTCYMNSTLQCLFNTKVLFSYFASGNNLIDGPDSILSENFGRLLATAFSKTATIDNLYEALQAFKDSIGDINSSFVGYSQHDAHEIFRFILEKMHKELNQARISNQPYTEFKLPPSITLAKHAEEWKKFSTGIDNSKIYNIFGGCLLSEVTCESCNFKSYSFENTLDLSVDIPRTMNSTSFTKSPPVSLSKCLQDFTSEVPVLEYLCSKCKKKRKSRRKVMIWKQPEVLIVHLKRFIYNKNGNLEALKDDVSFPLNDLELQPFTHKETKELRAKYKLYGFVNHYGTLDRGHYIAIINNEDENTWLLYDDDRVSKLNKSEVEQYCQGSSEPYLLCYKRIK